MNIVKLFIENLNIIHIVVVIGAILWVFVAGFVAIKILYETFEERKNKRKKFCLVLDYDKIIFKLSADGFARIEFADKDGNTVYFLSFTNVIKKGDSIELALKGHIDLSDYI